MQRRYEMLGGWGGAIIEFIISEHVIRSCLLQLHVSLSCSARGAHTTGKLSASRGKASSADPGAFAQCYPASILSKKKKTNFKHAILFMFYAVCFQ